MIGITLRPFEEAAEICLHEVPKEGFDSMHLHSVYETGEYRVGRFEIGKLHFVVFEKIREEEEIVQAAL